jgi:hypothetical protein
MASVEPSSTPGAALKGAIPDLFGESSVAPSSESSKVVNAVVSQSNASKERILGPKPLTSSAVEYTGASAGWTSILAKISLFLAIGVLVFFYSQLQTRFELFWKNPAQQLAGLESSIEAEQTMLNRYHWTLAKFALDDFSVMADHYLYQRVQYESEWTSRNTKLELEEELFVLSADIKSSLTIVKENISEPLYPEGYDFSDLTLADLKSRYENLLLQDIELKKQELLTKEGGPYTTDIANLSSVANLINHKEFQALLLSTNLDGDLSTETIESLFQVSMEVSESPFLTFLNIKNSRVNSTNLLQNIDSITGTVDPLYGSAVLSYIDYSTISLDTEENNLTLRGSVRTDDSLNFSMISDLIDAFEQSSLFADVSTRSFSKNEDSEEGYMAHFMLEMTLQSGEDERDEVTVTTAVEVDEEATETVEVDEEATETVEVEVEEATTAEEDSSDESAGDEIEDASTEADSVTDQITQRFMQWSNLFTENLAKVRVSLLNLPDVREVVMTFATKVSSHPVRIPRQ